jgi:hypothetical protein
MRQLLKRYITPVAWGLTGLIVALDIIVWGQGLGWHFASLSTYTLFPIFGLLAWNIMWAQYITIVLRYLLKIDGTLLKDYYRLTGWGVLLAISLHPGLLIWQLWHDGFGFPPESYLRHFVAPALGWVALLGTVSFFIFLAFELKRWFADRRWWYLLNYASDIAMVAIFYHGLRLGSQTQIGWFRILWVFYGIMLLGALTYIYAQRFKAHKRTHS